MIIDLAEPFTGTIAGGVVLMIIAGTYHYVRTLVTLKITNQKFSDLISEMDSLHKKYKEEIAVLAQNNDKNVARAIDQVISRYEKSMDILIEHNKRRINTLLPMDMK